MDISSPAPIAQALTQRSPKGTTTAPPGPAPSGQSFWLWAASGSMAAPLPVQGVSCAEADGVTGSSASVQPLRWGRTEEAGTSSNSGLCSWGLGGADRTSEQSPGHLQAPTALTPVPPLWSKRQRWPGRVPLPVGTEVWLPDAAGLNEPRLLATNWSRAPGTAGQKGSGPGLGSPGQKGHRTAMLSTHLGARPLWPSGSSWEVGPEVAGAAG